MLCSLNQDKLYNFVFSSFIGFSLQLQTCWISVGILLAPDLVARRTLAPLYLPGVAAAVHTVWCVPATSPFLRRQFTCILCIFDIVCERSKKYLPRVTMSPNLEGELTVVTQGKYFNYQRGKGLLRLVRIIINI